MITNQSAMPTQHQETTMCWKCDYRDRAHEIGRMTNKAAEGRADLPAALATIILQGEVMASGGTPSAEEEKVAWQSARVKADMMISTLQHKYGLVADHQFLIGVHYGHVLGLSHGQLLGASCLEKRAGGPPIDQMLNDLITFLKEPGRDEEPVHGPGPAAGDAGGPGA